MNQPRARYSPWMPGKAPTTELAVMGVGLCLDQHPAHTLWAQVEQAAGGRLQPPAPAGSLARCRTQAELFRAAALRGALRHWPAKGDAPMEFVENYPIPTFCAAPKTPRKSEQLEDWATAHDARLRHALNQGAGMPFHAIIRKTPIQVVTDNDYLWQRAFDAFDQADDLNSLLLWAEEGYAIRSELDAWQNARGEPLASILSRTKSAGDWSDSFSALLLGQPASVEWLRELSWHVVDSSRVIRFANGASGRSAHGFGGLTDGTYGGGSGFMHSAPRPHITTECVREPWSQAQMAQYDATPVLAWVRRPHAASFLDEEKNLVPDALRVERLAASIRAAVDAGLHGKAPARILYDTGSDAGREQRKAVLVQAVNAALPACDLFDAKVGYDLNERLGDTGAASSFASVGLASVAVWETGGTALVIHARRSGGMTVLTLAPPSEAYRAGFKRRPYAA